LKTFYPGAMSGRLRELVDRTTSAVNVDCIEKMETILDFAGSKSSDEPSALEDFTKRMTEKVTKSNGVLEARVSEVTNEIILAALAPRQVRRMPAWHAAATAALALAPLDACDRTAAPPPPDPLPVPTLVVGPSDAAEAFAPLPPPPDPLPAPFDAGVVATDSGVAKKKDAGVIPPPPPPDPLPPPTLRRPPPPPDPLPPPHTTKP
jgi:hypothetical protein